MFLLFSKSKVRLQQGFTLIEMIVVMAIFTIMTIVVMANLPAFQSRTSLDLLAEEVAITIRQAQVFGTGTRGFGEKEFPSHGVYFNIGDSGDKQSFILFADLPDANGDVNNTYDELTELREKFQFRGGVEITDLKGCNDSGCVSDTEILQILFKRPEADAIFSPPGNFSYVRITISSVRDPDDEKRYVMVWNTGHIYACNPILNPTSCS